MCVCVCRCGELVLEMPDVLGMCANDFCCVFSDMVMGIVQYLQYIIKVQQTTLSHPVTMTVN